MHDKTCETMLETMGFVHPPRAQAVVRTLFTNTVFSEASLACHSEGAGTDAQRWSATEESSNE
jgi:hypothetical protein